MCVCVGGGVWMCMHTCTYVHASFSPSLTHTHTSSQVLVFIDVRVLTFGFVIFRVVLLDGGVRFHGKFYSCRPIL